MNVTEIVIYSIHSHIDVEAYKQAARRVESFLGQQPGYRDRELLYDESNNKWIDLVHWDDMQSAKHAAQLALKDPECAEMFSMIVHESVRMLHAERVMLT